MGLEQVMDMARFNWIVKALDFDKLTDWESKFLENCERRMQRTGDLTPDMERKLEEIFEERQ